MKRHRTAAAILAALFATTSLTTGIAMAEQAGMQKTGTTQQSAQDKQDDSAGETDPRIPEISRTASYAMQEVQMARVALRNDDAAQAKNLLKDAESQLENASADAVSVDALKAGMSGKDNVQGGDTLKDSAYFAIGNDTMITESVSTRPAGGDDAAAGAQKTAATGAKPDDATTSATDAGGAQTAQFDAPTTQGHRIFRVDEVEMVEVAALVPHDATVKAIDAALSAIDKPDLQSADRHLASVGDGVVIATLTGREMPGTGDAGQTGGASATEDSAS